MNEKLAVVLIIAYFAAGYWAVNKTIYANKVVVYGRIGDLFIQKMIWAGVLGWALIPVALIKKLLGR